MIFEAISSEEESGQKASEDMAVEIKQHLLVNIN